ncbi:MAG: ABC transporter permease [Nitrososphaerota archaeon]|nr:ABC transporter permease [Nitrososphaerota archaeon]
MNTYKYRFPILALTVLGFVLVWWAVADIVNNVQDIAGPYGTAQQFMMLFTYPPYSNLFFSAFQTTIISIFGGFALAAVIGVPIGIVMGRYLLADYLFDPWVNAWYSIPAVAFVPLTMNFTGLSSTSALVVAFLIAVFAIIINVYTGVKNVSNSLVEPGLSYGAKQSQIMSKIILPAAMPNIMIGLRLGVARAIDGVIIAEMIFSVLGLGGMIFDAADKLQIGLSIAVILVLAALSIALNEIMKYLTKKVVAWKEAAAMIRE